MRSATVARLGLILLLLAAAAPASRAGDDPDAFAEMDHYNRGVALYRDERFEESAEAFRKAVAATDPVLAARARFNLGNADYARALNSLESQDPGAVPAAIELVRNAIESYRSALRLAPQDDDARFNLELASKLMRQLEQQQEQEQEKETKEQKQPEGEKGEQEKPKEGNQQDQGGEPPPEQQSPSENNEQPGENQDGEGEDGEGDNQDKSDEPQDQPGGSGSESEEESSSKPESSGATSDDAKETNDQSPGESSDPQPTPEGELTAAGGSESSQQPADESSESSSEALRMTQEEARKLLQTIRDRDMLRRLRRQAAQRARQIPVERDW